MGRPSAKERKPYNLDALLDVAVRVFLERGYDGSSLDQVAQAAGITKASIYYHVRSKEELLLRGVGRIFDAFYAVFDEPKARTGPSIDRLRHVLVRAIEVITVMLPEAALLMRVRGNTRAERRILDRRRDFDRMIVKLFTEAQKDGAIRKDIPAGLVDRFVFGMLNSITEWYRPGGPMGTKDVADAALKIAFQGISPTQARSPARSATTRKRRS